MSVNTVEALITLGKSLIGPNYIPPLNATDAEVIDSIADEIVANGMSAGGNVESRFLLVYPVGGGSGWSANTDTGLTIDDFKRVLTFIEMVFENPEPYHTSSALAKVIEVVEYESAIFLVCVSPDGTGAMLIFHYYPESGYISTSDK